MSGLKQAIMNLVPADGSAIGKRALLEQLQQQGHDIDQTAVSCCMASRWMKEDKPKEVEHLVAEAFDMTTDN